MKVAALDLGSNTFLCLIAEVGQNKILQVYADDVEIVRLGQGLSEGECFHPDALDRADKCLKKMSQLIQKHQPQVVLGMATAAARKAKNQEALFEVGKKYGIPIEIIPGDKEAAITYQGAVSGLKDQNKNLLVIDIGGGSTEFIYGRGAQLVAAKSYNIGCVNLTEKFITSQPTKDEDVYKASDVIAQHVYLASQLCPAEFKIDEILAVAGTPTTLAAAIIGKFDPDLVDGYVLTLPLLLDWKNKIQQSTLEQKMLLGIPSGRADVILIGILILIETLKKFKLNQITVSTRGVRYGIALEIDRRYQFNS